MKLSITCLLLILKIIVQAQNLNEPFNKENFPEERYQVTYTRSDFHGFVIEFAAVKDTKETFGAGECYIFLNVFKYDSLINWKSVGKTWSGGTYGIPKDQPMRKFFMFSYFGEWNGSITLIDTTGNFIAFPGYYWAISSDNNYILTKAIFPDSELPATKFDIESGEFITKEWLIGLQGDPWIEIKHSEYRGLEIGLCER
jgi:hypothetical protein